MSLIDADGQGTFKFALGGRPEEEYVMATPAEPMRFTEDIYITGEPDLSHDVPLLSAHVKSGGCPYRQAQWG